MRHRKNKKVFSRQAAPRRALMRDLATSLVLHGKMKTTEAKAKALRPFVERLVTSAKRGTLTDRRQLLAVLRTEAAVKKILDVVAPKYRERKGGYLRIVRIGPRQGDGAGMVHIEFVS